MFVLVEVYETFEDISSDSVTSDGTFSFPEVCLAISLLTNILRLNRTTSCVWLTSLLSNMVELVSYDEIEDDSKFICCSKSMVDDIKDV
jgi:hypothetical protein